MASYGGTIPPIPPGPSLATDYLTNYYFRHVPKDHSSFLLLITAARLTDLAVIQYERLRRALASIDAGSMVQGMIQAQGELYLVLVPFHRALVALDQAAFRPDVNIVVPAALLTANGAVKTMRDHFEHIDERALELVKVKPAPRPEAFASAFGLIEDGKVKFGPNEIDLGDLAEWLNNLRECLSAWLRTAT